MRPLVLIAVLAVATSICVVGSTSIADETLKSRYVPQPQPPHPTPHRVYASPNAALPVEPVRVAADKSHTKIKLKRSGITMSTGTESFLDLDARVLDISVDDPKCVSIKAISEKSVTLKALQLGVTRVTLRTAEQSRYTLFVSVVPNITELSRQLEQFKIKHLGLNLYNGDLHLSGIVQRREDVKKILAVAANFAPRIVSRLHVENKSGEIDVTQIVVDCHIVEFQAFEGSIRDALQKALPRMSESGFYLEDGLQFEDFVKRLSKHGQTKILGEAKLVTTDGRPAKVHNGTEIAIPSGQLNAVEYRPIGTIAEVTPIMVDDDRVRLRLNLEVHAVDPKITVDDAGKTPLISTLRTCTTLEMKFGQTSVTMGPLMVRRKTSADANVEESQDLSTIAIFVVRVESIAPTDPASKTNATSTATKPKTTVRK